MLVIGTRARGFLSNASASPKALFSKGVTSPQTPSPPPQQTEAADKDAGYNTQKTHRPPTSTDPCPQSAPLCSPYLQEDK